MSVDAKNIIQAAEIPSIPHVLQQILSLADNPRSSSADLEKYVTQEPALSSQLLKWVNSAAYALPTRVSSISHSMILLGFSTVKSIASGMILINTFDDVSGLSKEYVSTVWRHTLEAASVVKIFAKREPINKKDDLFLACMIHDVGYLVLSQYFGAKFNDLLGSSPFPSPEAEQKALEINHPDVGAELLEEWKFPESVIELVKFHHRIDEYEGEQQDLYYIKVSDALTSCEDIEAFIDQEEESVDPEILSDLEKIKWTWREVQLEKEAFVDAMQNIKKLFG